MEEYDDTKKEIKIGRPHQSIKDFNQSITFLKKYYLVILWFEVQKKYRKQKAQSFKDKKRKINGFSKMKIVKSQDLLKAKKLH